VKVSGTLPACSDGVAASVIEKRNVQRLVNITDPMSQRFQGDQTGCFRFCSNTQNLEVAQDRRKNARVSQRMLANSSKLKKRTTICSEMWLALKKRSSWISSIPTGGELTEDGAHRRRRPVKIGIGLAHSGLVEGSSAVRTNNEINSYSEPCSRPRWTLAPKYRGSAFIVRERAACIGPNAEKFDNEKPRAASFLFVRRGTQSYDGFIAAVPLLASPEHDARDDQHVRDFLDWRKSKCDHVRDKTNALQ
jgi:hypothetical protein